MVSNINIWKLNLNNFFTQGLRRDTRHFISRKLSLNENKYLNLMMTTVIECALIEFIINWKRERRIFSLSIDRRSVTFIERNHF